VHIYIPLEVRVAQLIAVLKLSIVIRVHLDCIVRQVYKPICNIFQRPLFTACSKVAILVKVCLKNAVKCSDQSEASDVKLSPVDQKGVANVLLDDIGSLLPSFDVNHVAYNVGHLFNHVSYDNAMTTICIFPRLHNPYGWLSGLLLPLKFADKAG
jgi:hypothetical protein